ncbi:MAG: putative hydrolase, partial [Gemmatimonadetes bacterium]|nr:putative hydrolase [Gemmatimonadota bacterium]
VKGGDANASPPFSFQSLNLACRRRVRCRILPACVLPAPTASPAHVRGEFIDIDGARLYYYAAGTRGAGEPVVFLHGFPTSGHLWSEVVAQMPAGHRIVVVDLLGFGRSDPPGRHALTLHAHAHRIVGLLDALGIANACVVGHDVGGGVAQSLAVHWPDRVSRLALVDSVAFKGWPTRDVRVARTLLPLVRHLPTRWLLPIVRADLERGYYDSSRSAHAIDKYQRPFNSDDGRRVFLQHLAALDARETQALGNRLGEIRVPAAVIWGEHDSFLSVALGSRLAAAIPTATFDIVPDARHFTPEDAPRQVAEVIAGLLQRSLVNRND